MTSTQRPGRCRPRTPRTTGPWHGWRSGAGINLNEAIGFDIAGENGIAYATITTGGISRLYTVNLTTGAATLVGAIGTGTPYLGLTATPKTVGFDSAGIAAGEGGTATLTVSRKGIARREPATVDYATSSGRPPADQDFEPASGTLSWANGEIDLEADHGGDQGRRRPGEAETLNVTLSNPTAGTTIAPPATATVTIGASDQPSADRQGPCSRPRRRLPSGCGKVLKRGAAFTATTSEAVSCSPPTCAWPSVWRSGSSCPGASTQASRPARRLARAEGETDPARGAQAARRPRRVRRHPRRVVRRRGRQPRRGQGPQARVKR